MTRAAELVGEIVALLPEYRRLVYLTEEVTKPDDFTFHVSQLWDCSGNGSNVVIWYRGYAKESWRIEADTYFAALVRFKKKLLSEIDSMRAEIS